MTNWQGATQSHALALTAGQLIRFAIQQRLDFEYGGGRPNVIFDLGANPALSGQITTNEGQSLGKRKAQQLERCGKVPVRGQVGIEGIVLKHHRHAAAARWQLINRFAIDPDHAFLGAGQAGNQAQ